MATPTEHTQRIKIRSTQMEIPSSSAVGRGPEDYDRKLKETHEEMERIQQQQDQLERKKQELEELTARKRAFVSQQVELTEKLTSAVTLIDRELFDMRSETEDLEQCRTVFAAHLDKIQKFAPENWSSENLSEKLDRATINIDLAIDEYDQAASHFEGTRCGAIFGRASKRVRSTGRKREPSEFMTQLSNGLAFNLPIITLGSIALVIYLLK
jgi:chromosome segregation ATPase